VQPLASIRRPLWLAAEALGPVWYVLYSAGLAAPAPEWLTRALIPFVGIIQVLGVVLVLAWTLPALVLPSVFVWNALKRESALSVAPWGLSPKGTLALAALAWFSALAAQPLWALRNRAVDACAARGNVVVAAIENYRRVHGAYPSALQDLVPSHLRAIPSPGALAYPTYSYRRSDAPSLRSGYELSLSMPHGSNGDQLIYWPQHNYPQVLYSGSVRRVAGWAHVRE
jgi:hypothetical protein